MPAENIDMFQSLQGWVETTILGFLKPMEKDWQPQDFLPDPSSDGFLEEVKELRMQPMELLPAEYFVCLVGDMITEEALPTYQTMLNTTIQAKDFGDVKLAKICGTNASDWKKHENTYTKIFEKLFELDPEGTMLCLEDMMQKKISMPAHLIMYDGCDQNILTSLVLLLRRQLEERASSRVSKWPKIAAFSWIPNQEVALI
ncbi:hypothetical protein L7F22_007445 [Adiantum nelumboides]|nr:hypothetical protein [Adiantum nelumboides]